MTYEDYRLQRQTDINALPMFWAFSDDQLDKELEKRNATLDDIYHGVWGAFYLRKDAHIIHDFLNKPDPIWDLMKDHDFAVEAFEYELRNHEYCYNHYQGDWDVITGIFGETKFRDEYDYSDYLKALGCEECIEYFAEAKRKYYRWCDENDIW